MKVDIVLFFHLILSRCMHVRHTRKLNDILTRENHVQR